MAANQGWQYNFYSPGESPSFCFAQDHPVVYPRPPPSRPAVETLQIQSSPVADVTSVGLKVFSPGNKREFIMFKLREVSESDFSTPDNLRKLILKQVGEDVVSKDLDFPIGFFSKSDKFWINNELDLKDVKDSFSQGKLTLWCTGKDKRGKKRVLEKENDEDSEGGLVPKKRSTAEERSMRVNKLKAELRNKHGVTYSGVQYSLWAEMMVAGTHDSSEEPPPVPMFGANRPRGRSNRLGETLNDVADKIVTALSPTPSKSSSGSSLSSPTKSADLRGKYLQQLKEVVNLRELGALTEDEYQEHRLIIVNLMKKL